MKYVLALLLPLTIHLSGAEKAPDPIEGTWDLSSITVDGKEVASTGGSMTFASGQLTQKEGDGSTHTAKYVISGDDAIDIDGEGLSVKGKYRVNGKDLVLVYSTTAPAVRPDNEKQPGVMVTHYHKHN